MAADLRVPGTDTSRGPSPLRTFYMAASDLTASHLAASDTHGLGGLIEAMAREPMALVALFVSPDADFEPVIRTVTEGLADTPVIGCTTAGEITEIGYDEGSIVAIGFPSSLFAARVVLIDDLDDLEPQKVIDRIVRQRLMLTESEPGMPNGFSFLLVDGLSLKEDVLTAAISPALAEMPVFGGSAGDGTTFRRTLVAAEGRVAQNAAVLTLLRTRCEARVFSHNHLQPEGTRMVVTDADPDRRIVKTINAEPAAREYARIVGKNPDQLDPFTFAAHPVVVRIGDENHVRAIQQVNAAGELVFFSAIDEGMVLTLAQAMDMPEHLNARLSDLSDESEPDVILACDCILRRIEALQNQQTVAVSGILTRHNVIGFSTYGEQIGPLHVNQTMTGVALYAPRRDTSG